MYIRWMVDAKAALELGCNAYGRVEANIDATTVPGWLKPAIRGSTTGLFLPSRFEVTDPELGEFTLCMNYAHGDWPSTLQQLATAYEKARIGRQQRILEKNNLINSLFEDPEKHDKCYVDAKIEATGDGVFAYELKDDGIFAPGHGKLMAETYGMCERWDDLMHAARTNGHARAKERITQLQEQYLHDLEVREAREKEQAEHKKQYDAAIRWIAENLIEGNAVARLDEGFLGIEECLGHLWQAIRNGLVQMADGAGFEILEKEWDDGYDLSAARELTAEQYDLLVAVRDFGKHDAGKHVADGLVQAIPEGLLDDAQVTAGTVGFYGETTFVLRVDVYCRPLNRTFTYTLVQKKEELWPIQ